MARQRFAVLLSGLTFILASLTHGSDDDGCSDREDVHDVTGYYCWELAAMGYCEGVCVGGWVWVARWVFWCPLYARAREYSHTLAQTWTLAYTQIHYAILVTTLTIATCHVPMGECNKYATGREAQASRTHSFVMQAKDPTSSRRCAASAPPTTSVVPTPIPTTTTSPTPLIHPTPPPVSEPTMSPTTLPTSDEMCGGRYSYASDMESLRHFVESDSG